MKDEIKPGRIWYGVSVVIFIIGLFAFGFTLISGILSSMNSIDQRVLVPGESTLEFNDTGKYTVYIEYNSTYQGKIYRSSDTDGLKCSLRKEDTGEEIAIKDSFISSNYSMSGRQGSSIFEFKITEPGKYIMDAEYEDGLGSDAVLAIGKGFEKQLMFSIIGSIAIFFMTFAVSGGILLFVLYKRGKAKRMISI